MIVRGEAPLFKLARGIQSLKFHRRTDDRWEPERRIGDVSSFVSASVLFFGQALTVTRSSSHLASVHTQYWSRSRYRLASPHCPSLSFSHTLEDSEVAEGITFPHMSRNDYSNSFPKVEAIGRFHQYVNWEGSKGLEGLVGYYGKHGPRGLVGDWQGIW